MLLLFLCSAREVLLSYIFFIKCRHTWPRLTIFFISIRKKKKRKHVYEIMYTYSYLLKVAVKRQNAKKSWWIFHGRARGAMLLPLLCVLLNCGIRCRSLVPNKGVWVKNFVFKPRVNLYLQGACLAPS